MKLKNLINRKGSYITESALVLPIAIVAMMALSSIILFYQCIENSYFIMATELRNAAAEIIASDVLPAAVPVKVKNKISDSSSMVTSISVTDHRHREELCGTDEIIALRIKLHLDTNDPLGLASDAEHVMSCITRAYVGSEHKLTPMSRDEFENSLAEPVYIFPKSGEKYHVKGCRVLVAASQKRILTNDLKRKYSPCSKCHSENAVIGAQVFIFPNEGENYHLSGCETLTRNYIEVEKGVAIRRGYEACSECG